MGRERMVFTSKATHLLLVEKSITEKESKQLKCCLILKIVKKQKSYIQRMVPKKYFN